MRAGQLLAVAALATALATPLLAATIGGTPGPDRLAGTARADRISGREGDDRLRGLAGPDLLRGGAGRDHLQGGRGADRLLGGPGADVLAGGPGPDVLVGGGGADRLLARGGGIDVLRCGAGRDTAVADRRDRANRDCERVLLPSGAAPAPPPPPGPPSPPPPPPAPVPASITVEKTGFAYDDTLPLVVAVGVGALLRNTSPDEDALDVEVTVTAVDAGGTALESEQVQLTAIPARATFNFGFTLLVREAPARVEVAVRIGSSRAAGVRLPAVEGVELAGDAAEEGVAFVTGTVRNTAAGPLPEDAVVCAVALDASGGVVGGGIGNPAAEVPAGGTQGFAVPLLGVAAGRVARVEVSVEPPAP
jgi:hypothetical protein